MTAMIKEETVQQWLVDAAQRQAVPLKPRQQDAQRPQLLISPASWVLPKLLRIVCQNTQQPIEALAPLIREMLQEQVFASTGSSPCDDRWLDESINASVAMLVGVLRRAREVTVAGQTAYGSRPGDAGRAKSA